MENFFLSALVAQIGPEVAGRHVGRVSLANSRLVVDLRFPDGRALLASLEPASPALYLAARPEKQPGAEAQSSGPFISLLRKKMAGALVTSISKDPADRVVWIDFEKYDVGGDKQAASLVIAMTGRTSNAFMVDAAARVEHMLYARGVAAESGRLERATSALSRASLLDGLGRSATEGDIIKRFFGPASPFGPLLEREFIARCAARTPFAAFESLLDDLFEKPPVALVYSRLRLDDVGRRATDLKAGLILSHIELAQAEGLNRYEFDSLSEAAEQYYQARDRAGAFQGELNSLRRRLDGEIKKRASLMKALESDRERFEDPERMKRHGDLILANLATAKADGASVRLIDYYDPAQPEIEIEITEGDTLQQAAADYFDCYQKARRAQAAIAARIGEVAPTVESLRRLRSRLSEDQAAEAIEAVSKELDALLGKAPGGPVTKARGKKEGGKKEGAVGRRFLSSDGYEIVVGRNDRDNDYITFRLARPQDAWLHAADYAGSHVLVRNPTREPVPHQTLIEAAEIAAYYSQARKEGRAAVHHTQRKFVTKPPRSKPGLVRLSSFKTLLVEPRCRAQKLD
jgi:predicted ribosome quality control (RQC) complex YloA/Tae2 family protein